jgi:hypothetical protein
MGEGGGGRDWTFLLHTERLKEKKRKKPCKESLCYGKYKSKRLCKILINKTKKKSLKRSVTKCI